MYKRATQRLQQLGKPEYPGIRGKRKLLKWKCPRCGGVKAAPHNAKWDDARTYCLTCTEETGRLTRRRRNRK